MYMENQGQKPSLNVFTSLSPCWRFPWINLFFPDKLNGESTCRKQIDVMLNSMDEKELTVMKYTAEDCKKPAKRRMRKKSVYLRFCAIFRGCTKRQAIRVWAHSKFCGPSAPARMLGSSQTRWTSGKVSRSPGASACCLRPRAIAPGPYFHARPYGRADGQYSP